jgi:hypothetical protein
MFYEEGLSASQPIPKLGDKISVFMTPGDKIAQIYPQALGISGPRERHIPYSL